MITNEDIYELLLKISQRIDILENKQMNIQCAESFPELDFSSDEWLEQAYVTTTHINILVLTKDGPIEAFKQFVLSNNENIKLPLFTLKRKTYLAIMENDIRKWQLLEYALENLVKDVWRKFVQYQISNPFKDVNQDTIDVYKQKIMAMRRNIWEVDKNKKELLKWLVNIC
tara:strand:+ start:694 stop:1206 length:513 start_codon:yes stop_codon:yes gene_type:complete